MSNIAFPVLSTPRLSPGNCEFRLLSNTQIVRSPMSGAIQTLELPGARWYASFSFNDLAVADTALLRAFAVRLRGQANRALLWDFTKETPSGTIAGTPLVNGAGQTGTTLNIDGVTAGRTLLAGDMIGISNKLYMVVVDATADGGGLMALTVEPPITDAPANNAAVVTTKPTGIFIASQSTAVWLAKGAQLTDFPFEFSEDLTT